MEINNLLQNGIDSKQVLLFDLDGTLIDTDNANNGAYLYAIKQVTGKGKADCPSLSQIKRITKEQIATIRDITQEEIQRIIKCKQYCFKNQLQWGNTAPFITCNILQFYSKRNKCFIITSADRHRAEEVIKYYKLSSLAEVIFANRDAKYDKINERLGVNISDIILFENDSFAIENATKKRDCSPANNLC